MASMMALLSEFTLYRNMINVTLKAGVTWVGLTEDQAKVQGIKVKGDNFAAAADFGIKVVSPDTFLNLKKEVKP
jgi:pyruvate/2-oxoglutarate dehydrogenase complex dihydrolipoamide dehydrogenase (E3) component